MITNGIKTARKAAHVTQEELAKKLNLNRTTISKYESGSVTLTVEMAKKIAEILGAEWEDILTGTERPEVKVTGIARKINYDIGIGEDEGSARKATNTELYFMNVFQFENDEDRIAFLWNELNVNGMMMAGRYFIQHLKPEDLEKVVEYMEQLAVKPKYQYERATEEYKPQK